jgi:ABC-type uncharacterized transport system permease subunit
MVEAKERAPSMNTEEISTITIALSMFYATLRLSTPLIFAGLGGFLSERSGLVQIGLEGFMLIGAFAGACVAFSSSSPWMGWFFAFFCGVFFAFLYGIFVIRLKTNQIITGTAFNLLVAGVIPFLSKIFYNSTGATPTINLSDRFQYEPVVIAIALVVILQIWFLKTNSGLWVKMAGENPKAVESSGHSVNAIRWACTLACGGLAALGGATLSLYLSSSYSPMMTSGRGFMALAALIFGRWRPWSMALAALLFGFTDVLQAQWQGQSFFNIEIPVQLIQILPAVITIIALSGLVGRSQAPAALGNIEK